VSPYRAWPFLSDPAHPFLSAVWAVLIHGVIALVVVGPILWRTRRRRLFWSAVAFVGGSLLDIDHFIAAGTFDLHRIETLGGRPATHSFVFVAALALAVIVVARRPLWGWTVFAVNVAHLLFDGAGGNERIYYPLSSPRSVPWLACPLGTLALSAVSFAIAHRLPGRTSDPLAGEAQRSADPAGGRVVRR
jgi:hypothetical protein